jgi:hypothetical protein
LFLAVFICCSNHARQENNIISNCVGNADVIIEGLQAFQDGYRTLSNVCDTVYEEASEFSEWAIKESDEEGAAEAAVEQSAEMATGVVVAAAEVEGSDTAVASNILLEDCPDPWKCNGCWTVSKTSLYACGDCARGYCGADCYTNRQKEKDCDCCGKLPNVLGSVAALRWEVAVTKALVKRVAVAVRDEAPITANSKLAVKHIVTDAIEFLDNLKKGGSEGSRVAASMVSSVVLFPLRHALCLQINVDVFNKKGPVPVDQISCLLQTMLMLLQSSNRHTRVYLRVSLFTLPSYLLLPVIMFTILILGLLCTQG